MPDKARLYLPHEWRDGLMFIARSLGIGSLETLPEADWTDVLARLEARMTSEGIIPIGADPHALTQSRKPMDMMVQGWSTSLFQASQQWSRMSV
jgi:hypothetical protein